VVSDVLIECTGQQRPRLRLAALRALRLWAERDEERGVPTERDAPAACVPSALCAYIHLIASRRRHAALAGARGDDGPEQPDLADRRVLVRDLLHRDPHEGRDPLAAERRRHRPALCPRCALPAAAAPPRLTVHGQIITRARRCLRRRSGRRSSTHSCRRACRATRTRARSLRRSRRSSSRCAGRAGRPRSRRTTCARRRRSCSRSRRTGFRLRSCRCLCLVVSARFQAEPQRPDTIRFRRRPGNPHRAPPTRDVPRPAAVVRHLDDHGDARAAHARGLRVRAPLGQLVGGTRPRAERAALAVAAEPIRRGEPERAAVPDGFAARLPRVACVPHLHCPRRLRCSRSAQLPSRCGHPGRSRSGTWASLRSLRARSARSSMRLTPSARPTGGCRHSRASRATATSRRAHSASTAATPRSAGSTCSRSGSRSGRATPRRALDVLVESRYY
jgi:hypothetical protein